MPKCTYSRPGTTTCQQRPSRRSGRVMPERADEATMLSDDIREDTRTALLAKAAALWADDGPGGERGGAGTRGGGAGYGTSGPADERFAFLSAYYRLVALEDLIAAGPDRL